jgi:predicted ATPase
LRRRVQEQSQETQNEKKEKKKMAVRDKNRPVVLIKKFDDFEDKVIYRGPLRKAKRMIPPSKASQYEIVFLDKGRNE